MGKILFEWDDGNETKSLIKHNVTNREAESCFYSAENIVYISSVQKDGEIRYIRIAISMLNRLITNVFTVRNDCFRIISSRPSNVKETRKYGEKYPQ